MHQVSQQPRPQNTRILPLFLWVTFIVLIFVALLFFTIYQDAHQKQSPKLNVNFTREICDDAYTTTVSYERQNPPFIDLRLREGCFSGWVSLPSNWQRWQAQLLHDNPNAWVSEWWDGRPEPEPAMNNQTLAATWNTNVGTTRLRVQGSGTLRLYRITMNRQEPDSTTDTASKATPEKPRNYAATEAAAPEPQVEKIPPQPAKPKHALLNMQPFEGSQDKITLTVELCQRENRNTIKCWGFLSNDRDDSAQMLLANGEVVDSQGNSFNIDSSYQQFDFATGRSFSVPEHSRAKYFVRVPDKDQEATAISFHLIAFDSSSAFSRTYQYTFKNVPVIDDEKAPSEDGAKN